MMRRTAKANGPALSPLSDARGTSLIEFGVAAPILMIFLVGVTDLSRGYSEKYRLQQVVNRSLETAQIAGADNDYSYVKTEAAAAAGVPETAVTLTQFTECGGNATPKAWDDDCGGADTARFITLSIVKSYTPLFGTVGYPNAQADGTVLMTARATLRVR